MTQALHSQARTTHIVRDEIRASVLPQAELAKMYNVTRHTIKKWKNRSDDASHRPKRMNTTLTTDQKIVVVELRKTLFLPTDDLLVVTR
jgi:transposase